MLWQNKRVVDHWYPFIIPLGLLVFYYFDANCNPNNLLIKKFSDFLNISLTLSGIALGFLGTMISAILSVTNSKVMRYLYTKNADEILMRYIREAAIINMVILGLSIVLLVSSENYRSGLPVYLWLYCFSSSLLCSFRIVHLLFNLLESVNAENRHAQQPRIYTPDISQLQPPGKQGNAP